MCLYPRLILNRKYTANKKNGGVVPAITDQRVKYVPVGCQRCIECKKQKARNWQVRLLEEVKHRKDGKFVTLTLSNEAIHDLSAKLTTEGYERDNEIATIATRRFLERWRKRFKKSLRHWLVTELGHKGTENIHLHGIVWTNESMNVVENVWSYGFVWKGYGQENYVNEATVNYITKYITKADNDHKYYNAKVLTSPGIGAGYLISADSKKNKYSGKETKETYRTKSGHEIALPLYYRNNIYTEKEREELWLQKLDKNERWVCGERTEGGYSEEYRELLEYHRKRNKRLGYGTDEIDWNREQYERQRRNMLNEERIKKARNQ